MAEHEIEVGLIFNDKITKKRLKEKGLNAELISVILYDEDDYPESVISNISINKAKKLIYQISETIEYIESMI